MVATKKLIIYIGLPLVVLMIFVATALGLIFYYKNPEATAIHSRKKLVIDHDGGADDAFAITLSLLYEKYFHGPNLVALTTTFGNVKLNQTIINSDRILALCNRKDVPIYSGARQSLITGIRSDGYFGIDGLGDDGYTPPAPIELQDEPAAVALIELSKIYEGQLIVVAVGPVTNIALAARLDPEFIGRLDQLYIAGGHIHTDKHPNPEFNAHMDPEAYYIVVNSSTADKLTLLPFSQVYETVDIDLDWRTNVLGKIQTPIMEALNGFETISLPKEPSWTQLDPVVTAIALDYDLVDEFRNTSNSIILEGASRGLNTNDFSSTYPNARAIYIVNVEKYKQFLIDVYSAELRP